MNRSKSKSRLEGKEKKVKNVRVFFEITINN